MSDMPLEGKVSNGVTKPFRVRVGVTHPTHKTSGRGLANELDLVPLLG